jgi:hypothetical protein
MNRTLITLIDGNRVFLQYVEYSDAATVILMATTAVPKFMERVESGAPIGEEDEVENIQLIIPADSDKSLTKTIVWLVQQAQRHNFSFTSVCSPKSTETLVATWQKQADALEQEQKRRGHHTTH